MTREEAIKMLEYIKHIGNGESEYKNDAQAIAIDMAIKALSEPTIPLSVIEDVKAEIEEQIDRYDDRNISEYEDCLAIIDRKIAKIKGGLNS